MMALGRESRGLTQSGLAQELGVQQGTVSKVESGMLPPTHQLVSDLCAALEYQPEFFFQTGRPYGMPPFHYRRRKKLGVKPLTKMIAEMNIRRIHLQALLKSTEYKSNHYIPEIDRDEYQGGYGARFTVENAARHLREHWMVPDGPIENLVDLIEGNGGIVIPCSFNNDLIDAVSQRIDGMPVLFFVNMNAPADRIRLTLAHELGHMVLHTTTLIDDAEMESEADQFAGAFLLPASGIRKNLQKFDLRQAALLKRHWKVSMAAIAMRADRLGFLTPYQKKSFFIQMGKLGYRKAEPHEPEKEWPKKILELIRFHVSELGYSKEELSTSLFISPDEFDLMYPSPPDAPPGKLTEYGHGLRVIK